MRKKNPFLRILEVLKNGLVSHHVRPVIQNVLAQIRFTGILGINPCDELSSFHQSINLIFQYFHISALEIQLIFVYGQFAHPYLTDFRRNHGGRQWQCRWNYVFLEVSDNGVGFPGHIDFQNPGTLGLQLIRDLTKQINEQVTLNG